MISVVIPVYNEAPEIERCLEAFLRQSYRGPFELILVDNGSTDGSPQLIRSFAQAHPELELKLIHEHRHGAAAASQRGFEAANFPLIARTDGDTIVDERWLEAILERFHNRSVAAVCGHVGFRDPTPLQRWLLLEALIELHQRLHIFIKRPHFWGFNFAVRREVFQRTGGFNTKLRLAEDLDLALRIQRVLRPGERIVYAPEVRVYSSSRRYHLNREWLRYTTQGYRAYFQLAWLRRTPPWMCLDDHCRGVSEEVR